MAGSKSWIGVDLDGTLARHTRFKGVTIIGTPIERMARRVRRWNNDGKRVKIFTARASQPRAVAAIKKWLKANNLPDLEVTNVKDHYMVRLWDDRAVSMVKNKGVTYQDGRISEAVVDTLLGGGYDDDDEEIGQFGGMTFNSNPNWSPYWMDPDGQLIPVPHHEAWARQVALKGTRFEQADNQGAYAEMRRRNWVRVVVQRRSAVVYVNPQYCSQRQLDSLIDFCAENKYVLVDEAARGNPQIFNGATGSLEDPEITKFY